jgi:hypothetical protein
MSEENKPSVPAPEAQSPHNILMTFASTPTVAETLEKAGYTKTDPNSPLIYALQEATGSASKRAPALAFTENPNTQDFLGIYKVKRRLVPDEIIKQIRVTDHLVAAILRARGNMMSLFGHLRKDRFDVGIEVAIRPEFVKLLTPEQYQKIMFRIKKFEHTLLNCGHIEGLEQQEKMTLAEYFDIQSRNGLSFGRFSTEIVYDRSEEPDEEGRYPFSRFRPTDTATIYRAARKGEYIGNNLRITALRALESLTKEKINIDLNKLREDEYAWVQVIDGTPRQAFTHDEMLVFDIFPSTDIEHNHYPVSPLDTVISSVTTHISIDAYKKLYFQNGRASKGMLVIQSDEVDQAVLDNIRLQFQASLNNVSNSFRTPIFAVGTEDKVDWLSMVGEGARDADFQFMYDQVARNILSAFNISPDELPGYSHLSRGTNSQTLSESSNEYRLTAARDTGLRPLILKFETFLNERLFPIMDPILSKVCVIRLAGIDAQSKEQETTRLQQDMAIHLSYDELLREVDKDPVGQHIGGSFPFNERYQLIVDKYMTVGEVKSAFFGDPAAMLDPLQNFKRDPFYLQNLQLLSQINPAAVQAFFAPKPFAIDFLKMNIEDELEGD